MLTYTERSGPRHYPRIQSLLTPGTDPGSGYVLRDDSGVVPRTRVIRLVPLNFQFHELFLVIFEHYEP